MCNRASESGSGEVSNKFNENITIQDIKGLSNDYVKITSRKEVITARFLSDRNPDDLGKAIRQDNFLDALRNSEISNGHTFDNHYSQTQMSRTLKFDLNEDATTGRVYDAIDRYNKLE